MVVSGRSVSGRSESGEAHHLEPVLEEFYEKFFQIT